MNQKQKNITVYGGLGLVLSMIILAGCLPVTNQNSAIATSIAHGVDASYYVPVNGVELRNYNWRQQLADDPSAILWCTSAFPVPSSPFITVPIIGKLTSGGKRPFPLTVETASVQTGSNEIPGSDNMYGSSGEYRYGFGTGGKEEYYDFYGIPTFCTTVPTIWQRENTTFVSEKDPQLSEASRLAHDALVSGDTAKAEQILNDAVKQANQP